VRAKHEYVQDLRFPGMLHARVIRPAAYGAALKKSDEQYVKKKVPGLLKVVKNGSFLAVIAAEEYDAIMAQKFMAFSAVWSDSKLPAQSEKDLKEFIKSQPLQSERVHEAGKLSVESFVHTA